MPSDPGPSVNTLNGLDCWRTWFFKECEASELFGVTRKELPLITKYGYGVVPYRERTKVLLEDAPFFETEKFHHRVCGPYEVYAFSKLPKGAEIIFARKKSCVGIQRSPPRTRSLVRSFLGSNDQ